MARVPSCMAKMWRPCGSTTWSWGGRNCGGGGRAQPKPLPRLSAGSTTAYPSPKNHRKNSHVDEQISSCEVPHKLYAEAHVMRLMPRMVGCPCVDTWAEAGVCELLGGGACMPACIVAEEKRWHTALLFAVCMRWCEPNAEGFAAGTHLVQLGHELCRQLYEK